MEKVHIVLVQLGTYPAKYVWRNLDLLKDRFPATEIVFISDHTGSLEAATKRGLSVHRYLRTNPMPKLAHNPRFRGGFWNFSIERLFAFAEWHEDNPHSVGLHIESDVLLLPDFPIEKFLGLEKLAWLRVNPTHDCAALLASPSREQTSLLVNWLRREMESDPYSTDMTALSRIAAVHSEQVEILPTWSESWPFQRANTRESMSLSADKYSGIFDAATIGMWLLGRDPRNTWGRKFLHLATPEHLVRPEILTFKEARGLLTAKLGGVEVPVYCLHVHSKEAGLFGAKSSQRLAHYVEKAISPDVIQSFDFFAGVQGGLSFLKVIFGELVAPSNYKKAMKLLFRKL